MQTQVANSAYHSSSPRTSTTRKKTSHARPAPNFQACNALKRTTLDAKLAENLSSKRMDRIINKKSARSNHVGAAVMQVGGKPYLKIATKSETKP